MLRVTPIYGSKRSNSDSLSLSPSCTLIEYGGVKILVNVGFDESLSFIPDYDNDANANHKDNDANDANDVSASQKMAGVPSVLPSVDAVILTDSSLHSLGGIPIFYGTHANRKRSE